MQMYYKLWVCTVKSKKEQKRGDDRKPDLNGKLQLQVGPHMQHQWVPTEPPVQGEDFFPILLYEHLYMLKQWDFHLFWNCNLYSCLLRFFNCLVWFFLS